MCIRDREYRFGYLKNKLFPFWDLNQEWKVTNNHKIIKEIENKLGSKFIGYCDRESKTICLDLHEDDWKIDILIVHEICHTFRNCSTHGKLWNNKMVKVSDRYDKLDNYRWQTKLGRNLQILNWFEFSGVRNLTFLPMKQGYISPFIC